MARVEEVRREPGGRAGDHDAVHPVGAGAERAAQAGRAELERAGEAVGQVGVLATLGGGDHRLELGAGLVVGVLGGPGAGLLDQLVLGGHGRTLSPTDVGGRWQDLTMIDHLGINCTDLARAAEFYDRVLGVLGHRRIMDVDVAIGYGTEGPDFWISTFDGSAPTARSTSPSAPRTPRPCAPATPRRWPREPSRSTSRACGRSTTPAYYGAFVRDTEGNNIEAVCHTGDS